jgi:dienelactone hydrolase
MRWVLTMLAGLGLMAGTAAAEIRTETVEYRDGDAVLEGVIALDDSTAAVRPGVLVVHEWKGLNDYAIRRAKMLAELGYVAFAVDMYGKGVRASDHEEAAKLSGTYRNDRELMRRRIGVALAELRRHPLVDPTRLAAIGSCFGGTTVLELARSGADVLGVVSFHGGLDTPNPADAKRIKGKVLVLHGAEDTFIPAEKVHAFEQEMASAGVDHQVIQYPGAVHSFTVPDAGNDPSSGMAYNAEADERSWEVMKQFLARIFSPPPLEQSASSAAP